MLCVAKPGALDLCSRGQATLFGTGQQVGQVAGSITQERHRVDPGARALPTLRHPDDLASRDCHLACTESCVTQRCGPACGLPRPAVHLERHLLDGLAEHACDRCRKGIAQPVERLSDICLGQLVLVGHKDVQPHLHAGCDEYGTASAAPANQVDPRGRKPRFVEVGRRLRAPYHDGLAERDADAGKTLAQRVRHVGVEGRRRGVAFEDSARPDGDPSPEPWSEPDGAAEHGLDVRSPFVKDLTACSEQPEPGSGRSRHLREAETCFVKQPVLFAAVAAPATRHDVVPAVRPTPTAGNDVIDVLRLRPTVLTAVIITNEHRTAGDRDAGLVWHPHIVDEPDDGRLGKPGLGGVDVVAGALHENGLVSQHEDESPS